MPRTHLVQNLLVGLGQLDGLLVCGADLVESHALGPVVECAGHVDLVGRMLPI